MGVYRVQEHSAFFKYRDGQLQAKGERLLREGEIAVLAPETVHAIANPLPSPSSAIHVYGGDLVERSDRSLWNPHTDQREDYEMARMMAYITEISGPR